ncbi:cytochrome c [Aquilutibacter rugosus]|uniref:cytochrome c n=1 Tax=Aquilutibacter rugosus TaxID=3115820 RepID=UPI002F429D08
MNDVAPNAKKGSSAFGRYFFVLLLGLVIGAFGAVYALNALSSNPQSQFQQGSMHVMGWNMGQLKQNVAAAKCSASDSIPRIQAIDVMARDLESAFPKYADDAAFVKAATDLRTSSNNALMAAPQTCDGVSQAMRNIGLSCEGCHSKFKD